MDATEISRKEKALLYSALVATYPNAVLKGDTIPYTSLNGHMYSFLSKDNELALKLPADERLTFIEKYNTKLAQNYGVVQKEYVVVPNGLLQNISELAPWFEISFNYVSTLKPKPTTKSKKGNNKTDF